MDKECFALQSLQPRVSLEQKRSRVHLAIFACIAQFKGASSRQLAEHCPTACPSVIAVPHHHHKLIVINDSISILIDLADDLLDVLRTDALVLQALQTHAGQSSQHSQTIHTPPCTCATAAHASEPLLSSPLPLPEVPFSAPQA